MHKTEKVWGYELTIVNTPKYCGKILHFNKGAQCSLHFHKIKDETFYVQSGEVELFIDRPHPHALVLDLEKIPLKEGEAIRLLPETRHRITALEDSDIFEFSTHHEDSDSHRIEPGKAGLSGKAFPPEMVASIVEVCTENVEGAGI